MARRDPSGDDEKKKIVGTATILPTRMMIEATDLGTVLDLKKKTTKNRPRTMGTQPEEAKIDATIAAHDDLGAVGPVLGGTATPGE